MTGYLTGAEAIIRALERLMEQDPSILDRARDAVASQGQRDERDA